MLFCVRHCSSPTEHEKGTMPCLVHMRSRSEREKTFVSTLPATTSLRTTIGVFRNLCMDLLDGPPCSPSETSGISQQVDGKPCSLPVTPPHWLTSPFQIVDG